MVKSKEDVVVNIIVYALLILVLLICLVPVLYVVSMSFTPYSEVLKNGGFVLIPTKYTLSGYQEMLRDGTMLKSMGVTIRLTVFGTLFNLFITLLGAYPLSRRSMPGNKMLMRCIVFTMVFNAGMIPTYLIVKATGLINTMAAMIIPNLVNVYNLIIMKAFFEGLPEDLFESARLDGCGEFGILLKIVMPMSLPILLTIGMYYAVAHWNAYMASVLYITNDDLKPLQVVLRRLMNKSFADSVENAVPAETMKMAAVCFATAPIVIVYPFIQKYFVKGTLAGAIKG